MVESKFSPDPSVVQSGYYNDRNGTEDRSQGAVTGNAVAAATADTARDVEAISKSLQAQGGAAAPALGGAPSPEQILSMLTGKGPAPSADDQRFDLVKGPGGFYVPADSPLAALGDGAVTLGWDDSTLLGSVAKAEPEEKEDEMEDESYETEEGTEAGVSLQKRVQKKAVVSKAFGDRWYHEYLGSPLEAKAYQCELDYLHALEKIEEKKYPGGRGRDAYYADRDKVQDAFQEKKRKLRMELLEYRRDQAKNMAKGGGLSKAGPFIGPRGGKWADAKHTIPWKEAADKKPSKPGAKFTVHGAHTTNEYGATSRLLSVHETPETAAAAAKNRGWYGGEGRSKKHEAEVVPEGSDKRWIVRRSEKHHQVLSHHPTKAAALAAAEGKGMRQGAGEKPDPGHVSAQRVRRTAEGTPYIVTTHNDPPEAAPKGKRKIGDSFTVHGAHTTKQGRPAGLVSVHETSVAASNAAYAQRQGAYSQQDAKVVAPGSRHYAVRQPVDPSLNLREPAYASRGSPQNWVSSVHGTREAAQRAAQGGDVVEQRVRQLPDGTHYVVTSHVDPIKKGGFTATTLEDYIRKAETVSVPTGEPSDSPEAILDGFLTRDLAKAAGPFIGPRGGKWADAKHTIPWKEAADKKPSKPGAKFTVHGAHTTNEYGATSRLLSVHETKEEAAAAAQGKGWYGSTGHHKEHTAEVVPEGSDKRWIVQRVGARGPMHEVISHHATREAALAAAEGKGMRQGAGEKPDPGHVAEQQVRKLSDGTPYIVTSHHDPVKKGGYIPTGASRRDLTPMAKALNEQMDWSKSGETASRLRAMALAQLRGVDLDVSLGGAAPLAKSVEPEPPEFTVRRHGVRFESDRDDLRVEKALGAYAGDGLVFCQPAAVNLNGQLQRTTECGSCGAMTKSMYSSCGWCGGALSEVQRQDPGLVVGLELQKSMVVGECPDLFFGE